LDSVAIFRRCEDCSKKRSLRTNSVFAEFPKVSLCDLIMLMFFWGEDDLQRKTARKMEVNKNLVSRFFRKLEDVCTDDIINYPFTPFGGPNCIVKCDESKFNHKPKVSNSITYIKIDHHPKHSFRFPHALYQPRPRYTLGECVSVLTTKNIFILCLFLKQFHLSKQ